MKIFLDSSFLIALINDNDFLHEKALEYVKLTELTNVILVILLLMNL